MSNNISLKDVPAMVSRIGGNLAIVGHTTNTGATSWLNHWKYVTVCLSAGSCDVTFNVWYDFSGPTGCDPTGCAGWTAKSIVEYLKAKGYEVLTEPNCGTFADGSSDSSSYMTL